MKKSFKIFLLNLTNYINSVLVTTGGSRPHVIFAKNEVRITVFDDGTLNKELPTGFSADVEGK